MKFISLLVATLSSSGGELFGELSSKSPKRHPMRCRQPTLSINDDLYNYAMGNLFFKQMLIKQNTAASKLLTVVALLPCILHYPAKLPSLLQALQVDQLGVSAVLPHQFGVRALLHDAALVEHVDHVSLLDRAQTVRDGDRSPALCRLV